MKYETFSSITYLSVFLYRIPAVVHVVFQSVTASSLISSFSMVRWSAYLGMMNCLSHAEAVVRRGATHSVADHWDWAESGRLSGPRAGKLILEPWPLWTKSSEHLLVFWKLSNGVFILSVFLGICNELSVPSPSYLKPDVEKPFESNSFLFDARDNSIKS